jgi:hypothetical protein
MTYFSGSPSIMGSRIIRGYKGQTNERKSAAFNTRRTPSFSRTTRIFPAGQGIISHSSLDSPKNNSTFFLCQIAGQD